MENEGGKFALGKAGVIENLLSALSLHKMNPAVAKQGLFAVCNMAKLVSNKLLFAHSEHLGPLMSDLADIYFENVGVISQIANAVFNISMNSRQATLTLSESRIPTKIVHILENYKSHAGYTSFLQGTFFGFCCNL
jgi:hypothetical protein